jgi:pilus assembly protein CpaC
MLGADVNALERSGLIRTLQEPNAVAVSGETANFFAGGEFPVPTGRDQDGNVIIEFRRFGVTLDFTPVVVSENRISLRIATEVSDLSNQGALTVPGTPIVNAQGQVTGTSAPFVIPAISSRRAATTVEMSSGGAIVIAGLIADETRQSIDGLPGLNNLPVLGALFRSDDFLSEQTELVIIATPYLVQQTSPDNLVTPINGLQVPGGPESFLLGRLNSVYAAPGADAGGRTWQGPHGFITEPPSTP